MIRLYLTRHGQTEWNTQKKMQGWEDSPLTSQGIHEAKLLGDKIGEIHLDCVYSSDALRALSTSDLIIGNRNIPTNKTPALREINLGIWEGMTFDEIKSKYPEQFKVFWNKPELFIPEGGESFSQVQSRAIDFISREIISQYTDGNFLLVCHTVIIKVILAYYEPRPLSDIWNSPYIHPTSLSLVEIGDDDHKICFAGDTTHIK